MTLKCSFYIHLVTDDGWLYLIDDDGLVSMTNDAEAVLEWARKYHSDKRVMYRDTMGNWDEMRMHPNGKHAIFARGNPPPDMVGTYTRRYR